MRSIWILASLGFAFIFLLSLTGCRIITSDTTYPIYDPKSDPKFDRRLVGTWLPEAYCIDLRRGDGNAYVAGNSAPWLATGSNGPQNDSRPIHLVKIGRYDYFFAAPNPGETGTSLTDCCRVEFDDGRIILRGLNLQNITDDLEKHPGVLEHEWREDTQPVTQPATQQSEPAATAPVTQPAVETDQRRHGHLQITDTPRAIRAYLIRHQDDCRTFTDPIVLLRIAP